MKESFRTTVAECTVVLMLVGLVACVALPTTGADKPTNDRALTIVESGHIRGIHWDVVSNTVTHVEFLRVKDYVTRIPKSEKR